MSKTQKRIYLINRDFQMRYTLAAVVVGLISTMLTLVVLLLPLYKFEILRIPRFLPLPIFGIMILAAMVNIFLVGLMGVFITHRIAGPMYALVRNFRRIEMGRWISHLKIRENDDLKFLVRNYNQMVDGLVKIAQTDLKLIEQVGELKAGSAEAEALAQLKERCETRLNEAAEAAEAQR